MAMVKLSATVLNLDRSTLDSILTQVAKDKEAKLKGSGTLRYRVGLEYLKLVSKYVPSKSGRLAGSGRATPEGRIYWTATSNGLNYASEQFYKSGSTERYTTPGTTHHWTYAVHPSPPPMASGNQAAFSSGPANWEIFKTNITPILLEYMKK